MWSPSRRADQDGMTMVELLVVITILVIIAFPLASVLVVGLIIPSQEQQRIADTGDAQLLQSFLVNDVQSASGVAAAVTTGACSNTSSMLELTDTDQTTTSASVVKTIDYVLSGSALVRYYCEGSQPSTQLKVLNSVSGASASCTVYTCSLTLTEAGNVQGAQAYQFTLSATRRDS